MKILSLALGGLFVLAVLLIVWAAWPERDDGEPPHYGFWSNE